jgi:hypothetical protein
MLESAVMAATADMVLVALAAAAEQPAAVVVTAVPAL